MTALTDLSATEIAGRIARKDVSAVQYVEACLERVKTLNPALNAIVTPNPHAIDEADRSIVASPRARTGPAVGLTVGSRTSHRLQD